jgi:opacity protein-like surface antigen
MSRITPLKLTFLSLCLVSSCAIAGDGLYVSANVGTASVKGMPSAEAYGTYNLDLEESGIPTRLALGYSKRLNSHFSIGSELGYNNYGSEEYTSTGTNYTNITNGSLKYTFTSIDLLAKATFHATKAFDIYGKVGVAHEIVDVEPETISSSSENLPEFGVGISYSASDTLDLDLSLSRTLGKDIQFNSVDDNNVPSISSVLLGVNYYFM